MSAFHGIHTPPTTTTAGKYALEATIATVPMAGDDFKTLDDLGIEIQDREVIVRSGGREYVVGRVKCVRVG